MGRSGPGRTGAEPDRQAATRWPLSGPTGRNSSVLALPQLPSADPGLAGPSTRVDPPLVLESGESVWVLVHTEGLTSEPDLPNCAEDGCLGCMGSCLTTEAFAGDNFFAPSFPGPLSWIDREDFDPQHEAYEIQIEGRSPE